MSVRKNHFWPTSGIYEDTAMSRFTAEQGGMGHRRRGDQHRTFSKLFILPKIGFRGLRAVVGL